MSETASQVLSGLPETLLIPLHVRAMESQRPDAMMKDEKAVALVTQTSFDFTEVRQSSDLERQQPRGIMPSAILEN
jgi:O-methyltransferase involved in polyketide biosynthesis